MTIIKNAHIYTMSDLGELENGYIIINDKKITEIGDMAKLPDINADIIDAEGRIVTPGLIDAHSHIGMWEDSLNFEGSDGNEETDPITPHLRAIDGVNPMDKAFAEAISAGVTTVVTGPGSANPIGGQILAMKTVGRCVDKMIIKEPLAIKFAFGENPKSVYNEKNQSPTTRMSVSAQIREALYKAKDYMEQIKKAEDNDDEEKPDYDIKLEALIPLMEKKIPMHAHAHRADDMFTAIRIAKEFDLDLVLVHATEGHLVCEELKENNIPVLSGPILTDRNKPELKNMSEETPAILVKAGVKTAIITDHPEIPQKHLALCSAMAIKNGLSAKDALLSITSVPAKICGIADRVGSIKCGLDADIVIWNKNPLDVTCTPYMVMIEGNIVK